MATTYCSVEDVADLLRIPITATTIPNKAQIEKIINRKEDEFDRRTGHAWRSKTKTKELQQRNDVGRNQLLNLTSQNDIQLYVKDF